MAKSTLVFDVHFTVPLKALETLVGLANDLNCGLVSAEPNIDMRPNPGRAKKQRKPAEFVSTMADAKAAVLERLRQDKVPVTRRILIRDLRAKGFPRNSVGPLCTEMKRAGEIVNPRRGYWALPAPKGNGAGVNAALGAGAE